jgi:hypothetical protein
MKEKDYCIASDLSTTRAALSVLRNITPDCGHEKISKEEWQKIMQTLIKWDKALSDIMNNKKWKDSGLPIVDSGCPMPKVKPPKPPLNRIIRTGNFNSLCKLCGSTMHRTWWLFGNIVCDQKQCENSKVA